MKGLVSRSELSMREIKFKFWDTEIKKWCVDGKSETNIYDFAFRAGMNWTYITKTEALKRIVVLQYTGLKDKNGVEIYEGDICTKMISPDENNFAPKELYKGVIIYYVGGFCLKVGGYYYPLSRQSPVLNVIGNIYQNESLLANNI